jgi:hypothetical protein
MGSIWTLGASKRSFLWYFRLKYGTPILFVGSYSIFTNTYFPSPWSLSLWIVFCLFSIGIAVLVFLFGFHLERKKTKMGILFIFSAFTLLIVAMIVTKFIFS